MYNVYSYFLFSTVGVVNHFVKATTHAGAQEASKDWGVPASRDIFGMKRAPFPGNVGVGEGGKIPIIYFMLNIIHLPKFQIAMYNQHFLTKFFLKTLKFPINLFHWIYLHDADQYLQHISLCKKAYVHYMCSGNKNGTFDVNIVFIATQLVQNYYAPVWDHFQCVNFNQKLNWFVSWTFIY